MNSKQLERWSPWVLLAAVIVLWQVICSAFSVSEFIFPSPLRIWNQLVEFRGIIAAHAWRTFWVTMAGFGLAIVVGVIWTLVWSAYYLFFARRVFTHGEEWRSREDAVAAETAETPPAVATEPLPE